jgi:hypothetical protein
VSFLAILFSIEQSIRNRGSPSDIKARTSLREPCFSGEMTGTFFQFGISLLTRRQILQFEITIFFQDCSNGGFYILNSISRGQFPIKWFGCIVGRTVCFLVISEVWNWKTKKAGAWRR